RRPTPRRSSGGAGPGGPPRRARRRDGAPARPHRTSCGSPRSERRPAMTDVLVPPAAPPAGGPGAGPAPEGGRGRRAVPAWVWVLPPVAALGFAFLYALGLVVVGAFAAPVGAGVSGEVYAESAASAGWRRGAGAPVLR